MSAFSHLPFLMREDVRDREGSHVLKAVSSQPCKGLCVRSSPESSSFLHIPYYLFFKHCAPDPQPPTCIVCPSCRLLQHAAEWNVDQDIDTWPTRQFRQDKSASGQAWQRELTFTSCPLISTDNKTNQCHFKNSKMHMHQPLAFLKLAVSKHECNIGQEQRGKLWGSQELASLPGLWPVPLATDLIGIHSDAKEKCEENQLSLEKSWWSLLCSGLAPPWSCMPYCRCRGSHPSSMRTTP